MKQRAVAEPNISKSPPPPKKKKKKKQKKNKQKSGILGLKS
jgi:hypothetical protein